MIINAILVITSALVGAYIYRRGMSGKSVFSLPDPEPEAEPTTEWDEI